MFLSGIQEKKTTDYAEKQDKRQKTKIPASRDQATSTQ